MTVTRHRVIKMITKTYMPIAILFALGLYGIVSIICNVSLQKTWNLININCLFLSLLEIFHSFGEFLIICEGTTNLDLYLPLLGTHGHWEWGSWASPTHCDMGSQFLWSSSKTSDFQTVTLGTLLLIRSLTLCLIKLCLVV